MNYRERIRKAIECPQFGNERYGEWGALNLEKRILIKRLLDELDRADNYVKRLYLGNQELKKQLEEYQQELEKADSITQSCIFNGKEESKISYRKCLNVLDKKEIQQKEFIKYLEDEIQSCEAVSDLLFNSNKEMKVYEEILKKYKSIIGGKDV